MLVTAIIAAMQNSGSSTASQVIKQITGGVKR